MDRLINVSYFRNRREYGATIKLHRDLEEDMAHKQTAFCFHDWCYLILKWKVPSCTELDIYKLVQSIPISVPSWELGHRDHKLLGSLSDPALRWLALNSSPSICPPLMSQLPKELRDCIWEHGDLSTPLNAFTRVTECSSNLIQSLGNAGSREISLQAGSHLSLKLVDIFGTVYIQDINNSQGSIEIPGIVTQLEYAMSLGGICAIKLVGSDWDSGWLGNILNTACIWHGMIREPGPRIRCTFNVSLWQDNLQLLIKLEFVLHDYHKINRRRENPSR